MEHAAAERHHAGSMATQTVLPAWAKWPTNPEFGAWTVGVEEEVMLLETDG